MSIGRATEPRDGIRRVLVCDDERHIVRLIEVNLGRQGYAVACCYSGSECLALLGQGEFDLLILDVEMDFASTIVEQVRSDSRHSSMRILLLGEKPEGWPPGGPTGSPPAVFVTKPFNPALAVAQFV